MPVFDRPTWRRRSPREFTAEVDGEGNVVVTTVKADPHHHVVGIYTQAEFDREFEATDRHRVLGAE